MFDFIWFLSVHFILKQSKKKKGSELESVRLKAHSVYKKKKKMHSVHFYIIWCQTVLVFKACWTVILICQDQRSYWWCQCLKLIGQEGEQWGEEKKKENQTQILYLVRTCFKLIVFSFPSLTINILHFYLIMTISSTAAVSNWWRTDPEPAAPSQMCPEVWEPKLITLVCNSNWQKNNNKLIWETRKSPFNPEIV